MKGDSEDLLLVRAYTLKGVTVIMEIDLIKRKASMVSYLDQYGNQKKSYDFKKWVFAEREQQYMAGWLLILDAMKYAVTQTDILLKDAEKRDQDKFMKVVAASSKALNKKGKP